MIETAPRNILLTPEELEKVKQLMPALLRTPLQWGMDIANNIKLDELLLTIGLILRAHPMEKRTVTTPAHQLVENVIQYIYAHYQEDIAIQDLCKHLYVSRTSLCKIFKDHTGFTINHYLTMYRLQVACSLLQKGQRVNEVGKAVGFKTYTHFIRTFTNKLGHSPTKFVKERESLQNG
ncbi:helix-turn-helix domain-containing protein [Acidaminococcus timonensis]|uniref:helix-turn-helix domain-containing protein n=1 Tax=Acidaminococcus timonensis TaxID=1871002 RepID=UPI003A5BEAE3